MGMERPVGGRVATIDYTRFNDLRSLRIVDTNLCLFAQRGVSMGDVLDPEGVGIAGRRKAAFV